MNSQKGFANFVFIVILGVSLLGGAFYLGTKYSTLQSSQSKTQVQPDVRFIPEEDLEARCGKPSAVAYPSMDPMKVGLHKVNLEGPVWSPDCRYTASSLSFSARGIDLGPVEFKPGEIVPTLPPPSKPSLPSGLFVYKDTDGVLTQVYKPQKEEKAIFVKWENQENIIFKIDDREHKYNVVSKEVTPIQ